MGGEDLSKYFTALLNSRKDNDAKQLNYDSAQKASINQLKEKCCEVADDFDSQIKKCQDNRETTTYELPDKTKINIGGEKYMCPEILFVPANINK